MSNETSSNVVNQAIALIQQVREMSKEQGTLITELEIEYVELGEYSGEMPRPKIRVKAEVRR